jgi:alkylation response protein AidB-like acyl-CoA dehydrogenase
MTSPFRFDPLDLPPSCAPLRREVRAFLADVAPRWSGWDVGHSWTGFDRDFTREVARRGWIGMTWPRRYGGHERSPMERYVVVEELLAAGSPVGAHWVADRQSGPLLLKVGSEVQRERFLPMIARGEAAFCIGLSEPDAGSDLASLRSRATKVDGGWRLNGRKVWTTYAQHCDFMIGLFRTADVEQEKHRGLSQFLIDLRSTGLAIHPIQDLTGESHFNEVVFDDVFVPDNMLVGQENEGWRQVNSELAFERSGPDRYLSSFPLLPLAVDAVKAAVPPGHEADRLASRRIGGAVAQMIVLREMSLSILGQLAQGGMPAQEAAVTKLLGTDFEQRLPALVRELCDGPASHTGDERLASMMDYLTQAVPTFSLRGGTNEIMRGIVARGLGAR